MAIENARLAAELGELKAKLDKIEGQIATAAETGGDDSAEVASLKEQLATAEKAKADAEQAKAAAETAKAEAETRASAAETAKATAERAAETAKADAKAQLEAKEKSLGQRANQAAIDQMAGVGQPPPDNTPAPAARTQNQINPNEGLSGLEIARRQWATNRN